MLGAGSSYNLGATGGNANISLGINNMPNHRHKVDSTSAALVDHFHYTVSATEGGNNTLTSSNYIARHGNPAGDARDWYNLTGTASVARVGKTSDAGGGSTGSFAPYTDYQGNGSAFSIMPPYLAVNIWKRTS